MIRRSLPAAALVFGAALGLSASALRAETIALTGGTIHDMKGTAPYKGTLVMEGKKITAVGADVAVPNGAKVIDVTGLDVYPGMIDCLSILGLTEIGAVKATNDSREIGDINPNVRAEVAINPESELLPVARVAGITSAVVSPQGGTIAGTSALVHLDGWTWEDMTVRSPVALVVTWPSKPGWSPWGDSDERRAAGDKEIADKLDQLNNAFDDARAYMTARRAEGQPGIPRHDAEPKWEAMIPALEGKIPVVVRLRWAEDIEKAVQWGDKQHVRLVLAGAEEAYKVSDLLKSKNIPVILDRVFDFPERRYEAYDTHYAIAGRLHDAGIRIAFCMDSGASDARNLPYSAAMAAAFGLPPEEAMKAITSSPAEILGLSDVVGSLAPGLIADIMVTQGSPLDIRTTMKHVFIAGREISLESRHTRLYEKYSNRPKPVAASGAGQPGGTAGGVQH